MLEKSRYDFLPANFSHSSQKYSQTSQSWAAANGHEAVVKLLVEWDDVEADLDEYGRTALSKAAVNGNAAVVEYIVDISKTSM